jgi:hypothetical protein
MGTMDAVSDAETELILLLEVQARGKDLTPGDIPRPWEPVRVWLQYRKGLHSIWAIAADRQHGDPFRE